MQNVSKKKVQKVMSKRKIVFKLLKKKPNMNNTEIVNYLKDKYDLEVDYTVVAVYKSNFRKLISLETNKELLEEANFIFKKLFAAHFTLKEIQNLVAKAGEDTSL